MAVSPPNHPPRRRTAGAQDLSGLVAELGQAAAPPPALDDSLERDLGISSLERVEVLLRIERAYGIRLPDSVMAEAASPKDLVAAILRASQRLAGAAEIATLLGDDDLLMIFPEGTFFRSEGLLPFRLGAFRAAVERGRPIVPIALRGTRHTLPDSTWLFRHGPVDVTIGAPLQPRAQGWQEMVRLRDAARDHIGRGAGE
ncbi:MAG: phosphopantetheine-binding protein [Vicinamibacterales bacterium]|nr:phosphopantetheine-binding protein [Vicinamibacterales bacterium]